MTKAINPEIDDVMGIIRSQGSISIIAFKSISFAVIDVGVELNTLPIMHGVVAHVNVMPQMRNEFALGLALS